MLVGLACLLNSCAIYKGGKVPIATLAPALEESARQPIDYLLNAKGGVFSTSDLGDSGQEKMRKELREVLEE